MKEKRRFKFALMVSLLLMIMLFPRQILAETIPTVPSNVTATASSSSVIDIQWNSVSEAISYLIYRSTSSSGTYAEVGTVTTNSYSDTSLLPSTRYYYKVKATNSSGTSNFSSVVYASTLAPSSVPDAPENLSATAINSYQIQLAWDAAAEATSYSIYRATSESGTYSKIATINVTSYLNTGLTSNKTYYYKVQAINSKGTSAYSSIVSATTQVAPKIPSTPTNLTASAVNSSTINLDWDAVSEATSYYIYRATSVSGTYTQVATATTDSYSDTGLLASTTYYYKVKAYNISGLSGYSSSVSAKTAAPSGVPDIPTNIEADDTGNGTIELTWNPANDATSYYIYRATSSSGTYTKIATVKETSYIDTGVIGDRTYYYKVKAYNTYGTSDYSARASVYALSIIPREPYNLNATAQSSSEIYLDWNAVDNATSYYVYRATSLSGTYNKIETVYSEHYTDTGLLANTKYYYKVKAHNSEGTSDYSDSAYATTYYYGSYDNISRLAGQNRYETAAKIAEDGWTSSYYAVIASGEDFPDALSGTPLAGKYDAPILLTSRYNLETPTRSALTDLNVQEVYIIGGTGVISNTVEQKVESMGINVTRLAGVDRYETSLKVAEKMGYVNEAFIANGDNFPDALSIAPIASMKGYPILLTPKDQLPRILKTYIKDNLSQTVVVGGTGVVSNYVYNQLPSPTRLSGNDRYETNLNIVKKYISNLNLDSCFLATGENFPDALAGSALASSKTSPILLVNSPVYRATKDFMSNQNVGTIIAFGGTGAVSDSVLLSLRTSISGSSGTLSAPRNLSATAQGSDEIYLDWDSVSSATSYYVYRATSSTGTYSKIATVSNSYYTDTNVSIYGTYYYKVKAHNSSGTSEYSSRAYATTDPGISLDAPANLEAIALSSSSIYLTWDAVEDATSYYIFRATFSTGTYTKIATVYNEYYTNTNLTANKTYYYKVQAHNSRDTSSYSERAYATTDY